MKKYRFLIFTLLLGFLFFPKDAFALEISNVQFYYRGSLVHTFNKNEIQGQYANIDPIEVDALHINYSDVTQKSNYNYQFQGNFDMVGNRVFDTIRAFNINNGVSQQASSSRWLLYSAEYIEPLWNGNYNITADWNSVNNSNTLSLQFDLGDSFIFHSFRLNTSRLLNDGEDVGDSITNQTQEIIQNQDKNQQQTNERLDALIGEFKSCKVSPNLFTTWQQGNIDINGNLFNDTTRLRTSNFIDIDNKSEYFLTLLDTNYKFVNIAMYNNSTFIGMYNRYDTNFNNPYMYNAKFPDNINRIRVVIGKRDNSDITVGDISIIKPTLQKGKDGIYCTNKIDETNEKLDEAENTRKGIWETIKDLPNMFKNMFLSLFVPDENYFEDKFDELLGNVEDVLGFLAYPFTLITRTFEFFLTIEDTGNYVISWEDVKVPNFEEYSIIEAGSFDFATLLEDSRVASLRNIAFVFINALLLLAFLQLCHNKYNEVFGGDVSTTEFISVAEEYDIDYKTGEVSNIKHIEKKTSRRDIK